MSFCNVQCELHVASKLSSNCMTNRLRDLFQDTLSKFPTPCCPLELEVTAKCSEEEYRWNKLPCQSSILRSIIHTYIIHIYLNTGLYRYVICILYVYKQWKKNPCCLGLLDCILFHGNWSPTCHLSSQSYARWWLFGKPQPPSTDTRIASSFFSVDAPPRFSWARPVDTGWFVSLFVSQTWLQNGNIETYCK